MLYCVVCYTCCVALHCIVLCVLNLFCAGVVFVLRCNGSVLYLYVYVHCIGLYMYLYCNVFVMHCIVCVIVFVLYMYLYVYVSLYCFVSVL